MKLSKIISRRINETAAIQDEFKFWWVDEVGKSTAKQVVQNETKYFESLKSKIIKQFRSEYINQIIDINRDYAKSLAKAADADYPDKYRMPKKYVDLFILELTDTLKYQLSLFNIRMSKLESKTKSIDVLVLDWDMSQPTIRLKQGKSGSKDARAEETLNYGGGKQYAPILKGLSTVSLKYITYFSTKIAGDMTKAVKL